MLEWAQWEFRQAARIDLIGMPDWNINWQTTERPKRGDEDDQEPRGIAGGLTPEAKALQRLFSA